MEVCKVKVIKNKHDEEYILPNQIKYIKKFLAYDMIDGSSVPGLEINKDIIIHFETEEEREQALKILTNNEEINEFKVKMRNLLSERNVDLKLSARIETLMEPLK